MEVCGNGGRQGVRWLIYMRVLSNYLLIFMVLKSFEGFKNGPLVSKKEVSERRRRNPNKESNKSQWQRLSRIQRVVLERKRAPAHSIITELMCGGKMNVKGI